jgi:hypothetical protein
MNVKWQQDDDFVRGMLSSHSVRLIIFLCVVLPSPLYALPQRLGDLDEDGTPTVVDLVRLIGHINGSSSLQGDLVFFGDLNEDGLIRQDDVDLLADAILEISTLPNPYAAPMVFSPVTGTNGANVTLTGISRPNRTIVVEGGLMYAQAQADSNGNFTVDVPLLPNKINHLFLTASNQFFSSGTPQPLQITQDSQPPSLFIDFPVDGEILTSSNTVIAGRVGDMLSGFMGLDVAVSAVALNPNPPLTNAGPANVNVGIGNNGTFERGNIPLVEGTNHITVAAADLFGNTATREITLIHQPLSGGPALAAVSGELQQARVYERLPEPLVVLVTDADGTTPFVNKLVNFDVTRSDGRLLPVDPALSATDLDRQVDLAPGGTAYLQVFTDSNGEAKVWWTLGGDAGCGNNRLRVTSAGLPNTAYFCASAQANPVSQINVGGGQNQKAETGGFLPEPLHAWVSDSCNGVEGVLVTFSVVRGGGRLFPADSMAGEGTSLLTLTSTRTGHAEVWLRLGSGPGQNIVEASYPGNPGRPASFFAYGIPRGGSGLTRFHGLVVDNSDQPIGGAEVRLAIAGTELVTSSDVQGRFAFDDTPSGPAHLHVNGLTATTLGNQAIPMNMFPSLTYTTLLIPQADNSLAMPVLLPALNSNNAQIYGGTHDLQLTCEGMEGLVMTIRADSMRHPDGSLVTPGNPAQVSLNQVHHDDVPMPMPDGASPPFAWTLQPGGATFDPPVEIQYPNMSGLPAGAIAYFLSFDHDTERFEIVASGHVLEDGSGIVSDPGAGLSEAGWGCNCPPYSATCELESCPQEALPRAAEARGPAEECCPIDLAGPVAVSTNGMITITATGTGVPVTWMVHQPGGQVTFTTKPDKITLMGQTESLAIDDVVVEATSVGDPSCVVTHLVTVVSAEFLPVAPC